MAFMDSIVKAYGEIIAQEMGDNVQGVIGSLVQDPVTDRRGTPVLNGHSYRISELGMDFTVQYFSDENGNPLLMAYEWRDGEFHSADIFGKEQLGYYEVESLSRRNSTDALWNRNDGRVP